LIVLPLPAANHVKASEVEQSGGLSMRQPLLAHLLQNCKLEFDAIELPLLLGDTCFTVCAITTKKDGLNPRSWTVIYAA